jgi:hypothetical protein
MESKASIQIRNSSCQWGIAMTLSFRIGTRPEDCAFLFSRKAAYSPMHQMHSYLSDILLNRMTPLTEFVLLEWCMCCLGQSASPTLNRLETRRFSIPDTLY